MNAFLITLLVAFGFAMLLATTYKPVSRKELKKNISVQPRLKKVVMGPENPAWMRMYTEEMAKRKTAMTAKVLKKWIADDTRIELRPDISR